MSITERLYRQVLKEQGIPQAAIDSLVKWAPPKQVTYQRSVIVNHYYRKKVMDPKNRQSTTAILTELADELEITRHAAMKYIL
jgi:hypothetical protein